MQLRPYLSKIYNSEFALFFRDFFFIDPVFFKKIKLGVACTDLFPWRVSKSWQTKLDLMNISSFVFPEEEIHEKVELYFLDASGKFLKKIKRSLKPFEIEPLLINDIILENDSFGTFYVLHEPLLKDPFRFYQTCISERGYIAYRNLSIGRRVWKFVHGNSNALQGHDSIRRIFPRNFVFQPQVYFSDSTYAECFYVNPTDIILPLKITCYNSEGAIVKTHKVRLAPYSSYIFETDGSQVCRITNHSPIFLHRPIIFKYYDDSLDIFHG